MFKYLVYKLGQFVVRRLSLQNAYRSAVFLSDLHYYMSFRDRRAVKNNLAVILPEGSDLDQAAREVFRNFGKYLVDFFRMASEIDSAWIQERVKLENVDRIRDALAKGRGAIVMTAHLGNWELGSVLLGCLGYPLMAIALPHKERPVNELFNQQRQFRGVSVIPTHHAVRRSLAALHENKIVAVVADRAFSASGEVLDFFGKKMLFPKGPAILAAKMQTPIIPTFLVRDENDDFRLIVEEPIYPPAVDPSAGEVSRDVVIKILKDCAAVIEKKVRAYPRQWLMFRKFWIDET